MSKIVVKGSNKWYTKADPMKIYFYAIYYWLLFKPETKVDLIVLEEKAENVKNWQNLQQVNN